MFKVMQDMKPRVDYYLWNQVHIPTNDKEKEILENFLKYWDERLQSHGLINAGIINFSTKLNLGLLTMNPNLEELYPEVEKPINHLLDMMLSADL